MILHMLRAFFVLLMAAVGWAFINDPDAPLGPNHWLSLAVAIVVAVLIVCLDILAPRKKLAVFSGAFLGLIVGISIAYALSYVVALLVDQYIAASESNVTFAMREAVVQFINLLVGLVACYLSISFIMQTKDDFRFVIPYVEFSKQTKGARPVLLDTSVLIDGRITEIANTGILESQLVVPRFVLSELQAIADSGDKLKRSRGRRGLDVLAKLQANERIEVRHYDTHDDNLHEVDERLMALAAELSARVLTNDFNLNKVAQLRGVDVINLNELANALKPDALPGEKMTVRLLKPGEEAGQGVGYLDDGTMVVVEQGRAHLNEEVEFTVTNTRQTSAGRMIFGRLGDGIAPTRRTSAHAPPQPPHSQAPQSQTPQPQQRPRNESQSSPA